MVEAVVIATIGFFLGLIVSYPGEAGKYPVIPAGTFLVFTAIVCLLVLIGGIMNGLSGRFAILSASFAEGALVLIQIFPSTTGAH